MERWREDEERKGRRWTHDVLKWFGKAYVHGALGAMYYFFSVCCCCVYEISKRYIVFIDYPMTLSWTLVRQEVKTCRFDYMSFTKR